MKTQFSIIVSLAMLLVAEVASAQYYPGESCYTECRFIQCDHYNNFCDYDCYEVCYPYAPQNPIRGRVVDNVQGVSADHHHHNNHHHNHHHHHRTSDSRTVTRMRIQNPSRKVIRNGQLVETKETVPKAIAVVDTCMQNSDKQTQHTKNV